MFLLFHCFSIPWSSVASLAGLDHRGDAQERQDPRGMVECPLKEHGCTSSGLCPRESGSLSHASIACFCPRRSLRRCLPGSGSDNILLLRCSCMSSSSEALAPDTGGRGHDTAGRRQSCALPGWAVREADALDPGPSLPPERLKTRRDWKYRPALFQFKGVRACLSLFHELQLKVDAGQHAVIRRVKEILLRVAPLIEPGCFPSPLVHLCSSLFHVL